MKEQWTQDIRKRLAGMEQPAPELQWDEIFRAVDEQKAARRRKTVGLWQRMAVAAAVASVLAGGVVYLSQNKDEATLKIDTTKEIAQHQPGTTPLNGEQMQTAGEQLEAAGGGSAQEAAMTSVERLAASVTRFVKEAFASSMATDEPMLLAENLGTIEQAESNVNATEGSMEEVSTKRKKSDHPFVKSGTVAPGAHNAMYSPHVHSTNNAASGLTAKAYVAGALGNNNSTSAMNLMYSSSQEPLSDANTTFGPTESMGSTWTEAAAKDRKVEHHQPLRLGLSLRYQLNDRWSIEGGISYSRHTSDIIETAGVYKQTTNQELTFIGVPINANYNLWSNRYVSVYASAGAEVERMVKGKATINSSYANESNEPIEETVKMSRPIFSVNAAVGVEAKLGETFSLYAEPGVGYHFKNGTEVQTIYADKPFNASLNLGVRFTLK